MERTLRLSRRILRLQGCNIDDESLCHLLSEQRHLDELNLENVKLEASARNVYFLSLARNIRVLQYESFTEALWSTFYRQLELTLPTYRNEHVTWRAGFHTARNRIIDSLHLICPHITQLSISWDFVPATSADWLQSISQLHSLRHLNLQGCWLDHQPTVFDAALISMLQIRGAQLQSLSLSVVRNLSIPALSRCCPHLTFLKLKNCKFINEDDPLDANTAPSSFTRLRRLTIKYTHVQSLQDWACLLTRQLRRVTLHSTLICDRVLSLGFCDMKALQYLAFINCRRISKEGAVQLMNKISNAQLVFVGCHQPSLIGDDQIVKLATDRHIRLHVM
jgi:Leucine-rich repeat (LRR) protein